MAKTSTYTASDIQTLDGITAVRKRPGFFLGEDTRTTAAREIIDNAADEVVRGFATDVNIYMHPDDSIEVFDNGRGLPVDFDEKASINGIVKTLGTTMSGGNFDDSLATAGTFGVGASATNAISQRMDVVVWRKGKQFRQCFRQGRPGHFEGEEFDPHASFTRKDGERLTGVKPPMGSPEHGTSVRFIFDTTMAPDDVLDVESLTRRIHLLARLTPGINLTLNNKGDVSTFAGPSYGASQALEYVAGNPAVVNVTADCSFMRAGLQVPADTEVAMFPSASPVVVSAANSVWTPDGGTHQNAVMRAIGVGLSARRVKGLERTNGEPYPEPEDFAAVTSFVVNVTTPAADLTGADKRRLKGLSLGRAIEREVTRAVTLWASSPAHTKQLSEWANLALIHARTQRSVQSIRMSAHKKASSAGKGTNLSLPEKYLPCKLSGRGTGSELHICEGDSALSTIKAARDAMFQAAFPLRGKPLKTYNRTLSDCRKNEKFSGIEALLDCGVRDHCDPEKCRFDRIILTCDADVDGYNIAASTMVMFTQFYRPLIDEGMLFVAVPPLLIVTTTKNERFYCVDEEARDEVLEQLSHQRKTVSDIQRCKGLGEMTAKDFKATVMNPATRSLIQITYGSKDVSTIDTVFGSSAADRRAWMSTKSSEGTCDPEDVMS